MTTVRCSFVVLGLAVVSTACSATSPHMRPNPGYEMAPADADTAQIVFVRPSSFAKGIAPTIVDTQKHYIGEALPNASFVVWMPAGQHHFIAWGEGTHSLKADVAAGKTYYVEVAANMGVWAARFHLKAVKPDTPRYKELQAWLQEVTPHEVLLEQGQQRVVDARPVDVQDVIQKGVTRFDEYDAQEAAERTLSPTDGI